MGENRKVLFTICFVDDDGNIITQRGLTASWPNDMKDKLLEIHDLDANNFIAEVLHANIIQNISVETIKEMIEEVEKKV